MGVVSPLKRRCVHSPIYNKVIMEQEKNMVASLALHAVLEPVFNEVSILTAYSDSSIVSSPMKSSWRLMTRI